MFCYILTHIFTAYNASDSSSVWKSLLRTSHKFHGTGLNFPTLSGLSSRPVYASSRGPAVWYHWSSSSSWSTWPWRCCLVAGMPTARRGSRQRSGVCRLSRWRRRLTSRVCSRIRCIDSSICRTLSTLITSANILYTDRSHNMYTRCIDVARYRVPES